MALSVAAAIAFHQAQRGTKAITSPRDYIDALDLAAGALSRLIPIYVMDDELLTRVGVILDLSQGRFTEGATAFEYHSGLKLAPLSVLRGDLTSALVMIRQAGPALAFALEAPRRQASATPEPPKVPRREPSE